MNNLILSEGIQDWIGKYGNASDLEIHSHGNVYSKTNKQKNKNS